jgi:hypothetical protein
MSSARHFFSRNTLSDDQLKADITADIKATRGAQEQMKAVGNYGEAEKLGRSVDDKLDELSDVNKGRWFPRHA